jgi:RNA-binding protein YlmH
MADRVQLINLGRDDDERQFIGRAWDWAQKAVHSGRPYITHFLHPGQIALLKIISNAIGNLSIVTDGGYPDAERVKAALVPSECTWFDGDLEIAILHIAPSAFSGKLSHRDYLGAILGLGITRDVLGDILVTEKGAYAAADRAMAAYILQNLSQIGREMVSVTEVDMSVLGEAVLRQYRHEKITVAGLRLDAVLAKAFRISRDAAAALIRQGDVKLDFRPVSSPSTPVEADTLLSCRGYGRVKIFTEGDLTRKGRIPLEIGFPL